MIAVAAAANEGDERWEHRPRGTEKESVRSRNTVGGGIDGGDALQPRELPS